MGRIFSIDVAGYGFLELEVSTGLLAIRSLAKILSQDQFLESIARLSLQRITHARQVDLCLLDARDLGWTGLIRSWRFNHLVLVVRMLHRRGLLDDLERLLRFVEATYLIRLHVCS